MEAPPGFTAVLVFDDPTPNAIILHRITRCPIQMASFSDLKGQESSDYCDLVLLIARKMVSVWKHLEAYHAEERRLIDKVKNEPKHFEFSQTLFIEFDEFSVQIKSTLDYLVKVMRPMVGRTWTLHSFAEKGEKVLKALRNLPKQHSARVQFMEQVLFVDVNKTWLQP